MAIPSLDRFKRKPESEPEATEQEGVDPQPDEDTDTDSTPTFRGRAVPGADTDTLEDNVLTEAMRKTGGREAIQFGGLIDVLTGGSQKPHPVQQEVFDRPDLPQNVEMPQQMPRRPMPRPDMTPMPPQEQMPPRDPYRVYGPGEAPVPDDGFGVYGPGEVPADPDSRFGVYGPDGRRQPSRTIQRRQPHPMEQPPQQPPQQPVPQPGSRLHEAILNPRLRTEFEITPQGWADLERRVFGVR